MSRELPDDLCEAFIAGCPAVDGDERERTLREEIVAELTDHLQCAAVREQLHDACLAQSANAPLLWQRVVARFGDPGRIAHQIWWSAFWERLMTQRLISVLLVALLCLCGILFALVWKSQQLSLSALLQLEQTQQETRDLYARLIEQMRDLAQREPAAPVVAASSAPPDWNRLTVMLEFETPERGPVPDAVVKIAGISANNSSLPQVELTSNAQGQVDVGQVLYGDYLLEVTLPIGVRMAKKVSVRPGVDQLERILCPARAETEAEFTIVPPSLPAEWAPSRELQSRLWYSITLRGERTNSQRSYLSRNPGERTLVPPTEAVWSKADQWFTLHALLRSPDGTWYRLDADSFLKSRERVPLTSLTPFEQRSVNPADRVADGQALVLPIPRANAAVTGSIRLPLGRVDAVVLNLWLEVPTPAGERGLVSTGVWFPGHDPRAFATRRNASLPIRFELNDIPIESTADLSQGHDLAKFFPQLLPAEFPSQSYPREIVATSPYQVDLKVSPAEWLSLALREKVPFEQELAIFSFAGKPDQTPPLPTRIDINTAPVIQTERGYEPVDITLENVTLWGLWHWSPEELAERDSLQPPRELVSGYTLLVSMDRSQFTDSVFRGPLSGRAYQFSAQMVPVAE